MTKKEKDLFIEIAQMGIICGLWHPYEWIVHYIRSLIHSTPYEKIQAMEQAAYQAFLSFMRGTGVSPDDPVRTWTMGDLKNSIDKFYNRQNIVNNYHLKQRIGHSNQKGEKP